MSGYRMFLPVKPDGTIMEMFPLRDPESALVAAAHYLPQSMSGEELRKSGELASACWRAAGGGWGFSDTLAVEMAKAFGYTTVEVFRRQAAQGKPKVELGKVRELRERIRKSADNAYCDSLAQFKRKECLGWEEKVRCGEFGQQEMDAHQKGNELMGRHQAFAAVARDLYQLLAEIDAAEGGK